MAKGKTNFWWRLLRIIRNTLLILFIASILTTILYRFIHPPITPLMIIRMVEQKFDGKKVKLKKDWVSIEKISPNLTQAVIAAEDNKFVEHFGFDFEAMKKAYENNQKKRRVKGGSTISQQTAKNVFLWPGRSYLRKGLEAYFTLLIEIFWSKERIMEVYLNVIEMGDGIYGAEMASKTYFNKHAKTLTREEAALITAVLPNPRRWSPAHPTPYIMRKQQWILWNMNNVGGFNF